MHGHRNFHHAFAQSRAGVNVYADDKYFFFASSFRFYLHRKRTATQTTHVATERVFGSAGMDPVGGAIREALHPIDQIITVLRQSLSLP